MAQIAKAVTQMSRATGVTDMARTGVLLSAFLFYSMHSIAVLSGLKFRPSGFEMAVIQRTIPGTETHGRRGYWRHYQLRPTATVRWHLRRDLLFQPTSVSTKFTACQRARLSFESFWGRQCWNFMGKTMPWVVCLLYTRYVHPPPPLLYKRQGALGFACTCFPLGNSVPDIN